MNELQSDELLVTKARAGSPEAFDALVLRYQVKAVAIANSVLRNMEMAKDSSQNAFAKAYYGLKNFREDSQFKTWFFRIVINEAKDTLRKEKSRGLFKFVQPVETGDGEEENILDTLPSYQRLPDQEAEANEIKERLDRALKKLPEREREVFILRYMQELSTQEVSETLRIASGTVKAHLSHATEKMKHLLKEDELMERR